MASMRAAALLIGLLLMLAAVGLTAQPSSGTTRRGDPTPVPTATPTAVGTPIPASADLHVTQTGADKVKASKFTPLTLVVNNGGPQPAQHVHLTDTLSVGGRFKGHPAGCKIHVVASGSQRRLVCKLGTMAPNATVTRIVKVRGVGPELSSDAKATASPADPTPDDAEAVKTIDLLPVVTVTDVHVGAKTSNGRRLSMTYFLTEPAEVRMNVVPNPPDNTVAFQKNFQSGQGTHTKLLTKHAHLAPGSYELEADARVSATELSGPSTRFFTVFAST
jgi:hypothetical protein